MIRTTPYHHCRHLTCLGTLHVRRRRSCPNQVACLAQKTSAVFAAPVAGHVGAETETVLGAGVAAAVQAGDDVAAAAAAEPAGVDHRHASLEDCQDHKA